MASADALRQAVPAKPHASPQPCRLRRADIRDADTLLRIEREVFPTQWPPAQFRRELKRPRTAYLVAVRDLPDSPAQPSGANGRATGASGAAPTEASPGMLARLFHGIRQIAFVEPPDDAPYAPRDYVAGFVGIWFTADEAHIVAIGVRGCERRRGVGELLVLGAFGAARQRRARVLTLEVRESNQPARSLYRKYGFQDHSVRKRYYMDNGEDAIIMTTPPIMSAEYARLLDALARDHAARWGHAVRVPA